MVIYSVCLLAIIVTLYPFIYVFSMSISDPKAVAAGRVLLFPVGFSLEAYRQVTSDAAIWRSFYNSIWYTVVATTASVICTAMMAYPLSRPQFFARRFINVMVLITMFFGGGLIPFYQVVNAMGLIGSRMALVVPYLIGTWNLILCRTFFMSLPEEMYEAAKIDGASEFDIILKITVPLSRQIIAVLAIFYGVANWNGWFAAMLFLRDADLYPLQIYLRRILIQANTADAMQSWSQFANFNFLSLLQIKYAVIIVGSLPMILVYPFLQKYFEKGIMLGSLKG